jgi:hypothetical protein
VIGRHDHGVQGWGSNQGHFQIGELPVYVELVLLPLEVTTQILNAIAPLMSQLPFLEVQIANSELGLTATLAGALGPATTKLYLEFQVYRRCSNSLGNLSTVSGWLALLGALPHVETVQITFRRIDHDGPVFFPVNLKGWMRNHRTLVEQVMTSAISACEQKGR